MQSSYIDYAMSVIIGRALPDARDGLKPAQRRILYAMYKLNNIHNQPTKKSARIVGEMIGKYHPHGDVAVYETLVRMAQDFSMNHTLVEGQGNMGSIDGDPPAAQRYTEVRLSKIAEEMLADLEKESVPFGPELRQHRAGAAAAAGKSAEPAAQRRIRHSGGSRNKHTAAQPIGAYAMRWSHTSPIPKSASRR